MLKDLRVEALAIIVHADADALRSEVLRRKGGPYSVLALMPPDPTLNSACASRTSSTA